MYGMFETHLTHGPSRQDAGAAEREYVVYRAASDRNGIAVGRALRATLALIVHLGRAGQRGRADIPVLPTVTGVPPTPATPTRTAD
jgi:hypothetical protein